MLTLLAPEQLVHRCLSAGLLGSNSCVSYVYHRFCVCARVCARVCVRECVCVCSVSVSVSVRI